ncbi:MAG: methyltransferase domain-containing protein [Ruminiclostridium sp.]
MKNEIGKRIAELRKSLGMNQEELAEKLKVTFQAVSKWETGATYPDIELLSVISESLHVSVDYLLKGNDIKSKIYYDQKYSQDEYYWGVQPSAMCYKVLQYLPPVKHLRLLDIGCGEGKDAVFFARNGYEVTAFDLAETGIEKTKRLAEHCGVYVNAFTADVNEFRLNTEFDVIYSNGTLHYIPPEIRYEIFNNYKKFTTEGGINILSAFVKKPFVGPAPDTEKYSYEWLSGELFMLYHDWELDMCEEVLFDCMSAGIPHKHAMDRMLAKKSENLGE